MDLKYMDLAFVEAEKAFKLGEVPIGAVIVKNGKILAKTHKKKEKTKCSVHHAEILAILRASKKLRNWRLDDCDIYVTLEPCPMCASTIKQSRIRNVYSALSNKDKNNSFSKYDYYIDTYDIEIVVNENNTFDIEEKIVAYFYVSKHGIFRRIPVKNEVERLDGTTTKNRAKMQGVCGL